MSRRRPRGTVTGQVTDAAPAAVLAAAEWLLGEAVAVAPIEESTLVGSGRVDPVTTRDGAVTARVGFYTPYAARQHEELGWQHAPGRRARYLAGPAEEGRAVIRRILVEGLAQGVRS